MSLIRTYGVIMLCINLAFALIAASGLFPLELGVSGFVGLPAELLATSADLQNTFENSSTGLDYLMMTGFVIFYGVKILILFAGMVLTGLADILAAVGMPAALYVPITLVTDAIILYELGTKLRG